MGTWQISADLLARSRFVVSPRIETVAALNDIVRPSDAAGRAFSAAHRESFEAMLAEHPVRRAVLEHSWRPGGSRTGWHCRPTVRDTPSPTRSMTCGPWETNEFAPTCAESTPERSLPRILSRPGTAEQAAQLLEWVWTHALATDWGRRERVLRADIVSRTARLATHGWAAVLRDLGRDREWLGDGQLRINRYDLPSRVLDDDAELFSSPRTAPRPGSAGTCRGATPSTTPSPVRWPRSTARPTTVSSGSSAPPAPGCCARSTARRARARSSPAPVCRSARWVTTSRSCSPPARCFAAARGVRCSTGAPPSATPSSPRESGVDAL